MSKDRANRILYEASKRADVIGVAKAIIHGGNVGWKNRKERNKTALDVCGDQMKSKKHGKAMECEELLLQNCAVVAKQPQTNNNNGSPVKQPRSSKIVKTKKITRENSSSIRPKRPERPEK